MEKRKEMIDIKTARARFRCGAPGSLASALAFALLFAVAASPAWGQSFATSFGGTAQDQIFSVIQTSDGGYATFGRTRSFDPGANDDEAWFSKFDSSGNIQFQKIFRGGDRKSVINAIQTSDGGFALVGEFVNFTRGDDIYDGYLLKLDSTGAVVFEKTYNASVFDFFVSVVQTSDGGYAIGGQTSPDNDYVVDIWFLKLDASGGIQFQRKYGTSGIDEYINQLIRTTDGGYAIVGIAFPAEGGLFIKLDSSGAVSFQNIYGGVGEIFHSVVQTSDGGYAVTGESAERTWMVKLDSVGAIQFQNKYGDTRSAGRSIVQTSDGGYAIAGTGGGGSGNVTLLRLNSLGSVVFQKTYGGNDIESLNFHGSLTKTSDAGYALAAESRTFSSNPLTDISDAWLLKVDANGDIGVSCSVVGNLAATAVATTAAITPTSFTSNAISGIAAIATSDVLTPATSQAIQCFAVGVVCSDTDGDGVDTEGAPSCNGPDNCPSNANAAQADTDSDGAGDVCDICPATALDNCITNADYAHGVSLIEGINNIVEIVFDNAGNNATNIKTVLLDTQAPTTTKTLSDIDGDGFIDGITLTATDPPKPPATVSSGVKELKFSINGGPFTVVQA